MTHLYAFLGMAAMDFCFAYYARRAAQGRAHGAGVWAMLLILFNSVVMVTVVKDNNTIIAAMFGAYVGTFAAVRRDSEKD